MKQEAKHPDVAVELLAMARFAALVKLTNNRAAKMGISQASRMAFKTSPRSSFRITPSARKLVQRITEQIKRLASPAMSIR